MIKAFGYSAGKQKDIISIAKEEGIDVAIDTIVAGLTGFSFKQGVWKAEFLKEGLLPLVVAGIAGKFAKKLGLNKYIKYSSMGVLELA